MHSLRYDKFQEKNGHLLPKNRLIRKNNNKTIIMHKYSNALKGKFPN